MFGFWILGMSTLVVNIKIKAISGEGSPRPSKPSRNSRPY